MKTIFIFIFNLSLFTLTIAQDESNEIATNSGKIKGVTVDLSTNKSAYAYLGIPFAQPPLGHLRFKPPIDVKAWSGTRETKVKSNACVQGVRNVPSHMNWFIDLENEQSEDCLYLNIWTPISTKGNTAVMIWIYGGGFTGGSGNIAKYDGAVLASEENVIVVTINFRVAVFGFLYSGTADAPGNVGLMDQEMAIKWVRNNIAAFGGDPNRITLFGESAGSSSVEYHLFLPNSKDLFQRAIMQSGSDFSHWRQVNINGTLDSFHQLAHILGCVHVNSDTGKENVDFNCLRQVNSNDLQEAAYKINTDEIFLFGPVIDGVYVERTKQESFKLGMLKNSTDLMVGNTKEDGYFVLLLYGVFNFSEHIEVSDQQILKSIKRQTGNKSALLAEVVKHLYTDWSDQSDNGKRLQKLMDLKTDFYFRCGMVSFAEHAIENNNKVYQYEFAHRPVKTPMPSWSGAVHGDEIDFEFGRPLIESSSFTQEEIQLSRDVMKVFAGFAKNGNPQDWPSFDLENKTYMEMGSTLKLKKRLQEKECHFWNKIYPEMIKQLYNE